MNDYFQRDKREKDLRDAWLASLKTGDAVFIPAPRGTWDSAAGTIYTVERMTKTQICLLGNRVRYRRDSGSVVGSAGYYSGRLEPVTADVQYAIELGKARGCIARIGDYRVVNKMPDEAILALAKVFNEYQEPNRIEVLDTDWLQEQGAYVVYQPSTHRHFVAWNDGAEQVGRYATATMAVNVAKGAQQMGMARCGMPLCTEEKHHPCCHSLFKSKSESANDCEAGHE